MFANFIGETCTGTTGTVSLTGAMRGTIIFSKAYSDGDPVSYFIEDGDGIQKCGGVGTYNSIGTITRNDSWTWDGTTYDPSPAGNLVLSGGEHMMTVSPISSTMLDWNSAFTHSGLTSGNPHNVTATEVGLGNVDNTSDVNKPISTATQTALDGKANSLGVDDNYVTDAEKVQLSNLQGDLDTHTAAIDLNTSKVTNATHTGDVTGDTVLTLDPSAITSKTALTSGLTDTDELLISDGGTLKRMDVSVLKSHINTGVNATQLSGYSLSSSGDRWGVVPYVAPGGVIEIGKYLDFHLTDGSTEDKAARLYAYAANELWTLNTNFTIYQETEDASLIIRSAGSSTLLLAGDTNNSGDGGVVDARILFTTDGGSSVATANHGYDFSALNFSGYSEFDFTQLVGGTRTDIMSFVQNGHVEIHNNLTMSNGILSLTDSSTSVSTTINKTGASGNILEIKKSGTTKILIDNDGNLNYGATTLIGSSLYASTQLTLGANTNLNAVRVNSTGVVLNKMCMGNVTTPVGTYATGVDMTNGETLGITQATLDHVILALIGVGILKSA